MAKSKFVYREGSRNSVPADVAGAELARIQRQRGGLSASTVVEEAEPESAPLHPAFEWDDGEAAHKYRLIQARTLIRSVQVLQSDGGSRSVYVHVSGLEREGEYDTMDAVVQHLDRFTMALMELEKKLSAAFEAVNELKAAASTTGDADKTARVAIAIEAMRTAGEAVRALH